MELHRPGEIRHFHLREPYRAAEGTMIGTVASAALALAALAVFASASQPADRRWGAPAPDAGVEVAAYASRLGVWDITMHRRQEDGSYLPLDRTFELQVEYMGDGLYSIQAASFLRSSALCSLVDFGHSLHSRSSRVRPPDFGRNPPHCLKKNGTSALWH